MADFAITQFVWTAEPYLRMLDELAALDCHKPVIPGIMLFINVHSMRRMSELNDTAIPDELWERCLEADGDPKSVRLLGTEVCTTLSAELLEADASERDEIIERARQQLLLINMGVPTWSEITDRATIDERARDALES